MDDILVQNAEAYAKQRKIVFAEELGSGIHGAVRVVEDNRNFRRFAVKFHRYADVYFRERTPILRPWFGPAVEVSWRRASMTAASCSSRVPTPGAADLFFLKQDDGAHGRKVRWFLAEVRSSAARRSVSQ